MLHVILVDVLIIVVFIVVENRLALLYNRFLHQ